jgi:hypothetical protein
MGYKIISFLSENELFLIMNKRFLIVGIVLGVIIGAAVLIGSPYFLAFDTNR